MDFFSQSEYRVRLEWGAQAIEHLAPQAQCVVILDVMSFSTCVSVAVDCGATVLPFPWRDERAQHEAQIKDAVLASGKRDAGEGFSLSPCSMLKAKPGLKLLLPSPNGSALAYQTQSLKAAVYTASFRNLQATADACRHYNTILVVPAGERWPDHSLRPCAEDLWAAGALVSKLGLSDASPEAHLAAAAHAQSGAEYAKLLSQCSSALELTERGFSPDVKMCLELDTSVNACRLMPQGFVEAKSIQASVN
jgi:2-phosphosulfolactate phosphatase